MTSQTDNRTWEESIDLQDCKPQITGEAIIPSGKQRRGRYSRGSRFINNSLQMTLDQKDQDESFNNHGNIEK